MFIINPLMSYLDVGIPFSPLLGEGSFVGGCCGLPEAGSGWLNSRLLSMALARSNFCPRMRPARFPTRSTQAPLVAGDYGEHVMVAVVCDAPLVREVEVRGIQVISGDREEGAGPATAGALGHFPEVHSPVCVLG
jgi:hypothetical protein